MKNRKTLRVVLPLGAAILAGIGWLLLERPHRDVAEEQAQFNMVPKELASVLAKGDSTSQAHLNAVVELFGVVASDDGQRVTLKGGVVGAWDTTRSHRTLQEGEHLHLKGRVTGYDDLFEEVRMDGLVIIEEVP